MFKFGKIAVLILVIAMLLTACGGADTVPAPEAVTPPEIIVEAPPVTVEVDTSGFEDAVNALVSIVGSLEDKVDALAPVPAVADETGGGGDTAIVLDEDRVPLVTTYETTDEDGNPIPLECGLAQITANPTYVLQKVLLPDGTFKENAAGNPFMQQAPNMGHMTEDYVCVESPAIQVDGGKVFRLQYAQQDDDGDWRGLGADYFQCCFVDANDVQREFYP